MKVLPVRSERRLQGARAEGAVRSYRKGIPLAQPGTALSRSGITTRQAGEAASRWRRPVGVGVAQNLQSDGLAKRSLEQRRARGASRAVYRRDSYSTWYSRAHPFVPCWRRAISADCNSSTVSRRRASRRRDEQELRDRRGFRASTAKGFSQKYSPDVPVRVAAPDSVSTSRPSRCCCPSQCS